MSETGDGANHGGQDGLHLVEDRTPDDTETLHGGSGGEGTKRTRWFGVAAVVVILGLIVLAVLTLRDANDDHNTASEVQLKASMPSGNRVYAEHMRMSHVQKREWYTVRGLKGGDTFTTTVVLTNQGQQPITLKGVVPASPMANIFSGLTVEYTYPDTGEGFTDGVASSTTKLLPGQSTSALVTWRVRDCPVTPGVRRTEGGTLIGFDVSWRTDSGFGTYPVDLPYQVQVVNAPSC